jgi:hypothetical protein
MSKCVKISAPGNSAGNTSSLRGITSLNRNTRGNYLLLCEGKLEKVSRLGSKQLTVGSGLGLVVLEFPNLSEA